MSMAPHPASDITLRYRELFELLLFERQSSVVAGSRLPQEREAALDAELRAVWEQMTEDERDDARRLLGL